MEKEYLSKEDEKRVNSCEYYQMTKNIMKSHEEYKNLNVGEVYFIKYKRHNGEYNYVSRTYGSTKKDKYMVFHKDDDGFVFVKRVNASGKLGKEVQCLTTQYPMPKYEIEPDPEYLDSILFEDEGSYDPLKAEKELNSKKGKARRRNKKLEIKHETAQEAYDYIKSLTVGSTLYDTGTSYGDGLMIWTVEKIDKFPVDKEKVRRYGGRDHNVHSNQNFTEVVKIHLKSNCNTRRWTNNKQEVTFYNFWKDGYKTFYSSKPYTTDDF